MEELKRVCKACGIEHNIEYYSRNKEAPNGRESRCKSCKKNKILIPRNPPLNPKKTYNQTRFIDIVRLDKPNQEDYELTYQFLLSLGYDVSKDIHQQFLDKWNPQSKKPMKYKKRALNNQSSYLYDGSLNLNSAMIKQQKYRKTV